MWIPLLFVILIFAIAVLQSSQGAFSALIMTVLTICCAAASIGTYEWIAVKYLMAWKPDYAHAIAIAVVFGIPLLILRLVTDKLIRRTCLLPGWFDRAGAGLCGLITGFVVTGMLEFALTNVPMGVSFLGYQRVLVTPDPEARKTSSEEPPDPRAPIKEYYLTPDRFAVGLATLLSHGIFAGEHGLAEGNPDIVEATAWLNAVPATVSRYAAAGSISVKEVSKVPFVYKHKIPPPRSHDPPQFDPVSPGSGNEFWAVRVALGNAARDTRKSHLFTIRQFRLVGRERNDGPFGQYYPIAIQQQDDTQAVNRHISHVHAGGKYWSIVDDLFKPRDGKINEVEVVFELPKGFAADFLEYKRSGRAKITLKETPGTTSAPATPSSATVTSTPPTPPPTEPETRRGRSRRNRRERSEDETVADSGRGGNVRGITTVAASSFFGDQTPIELKAYQADRDPQVRRGRIRNGHFVGNMDEQAGGQDRPASHFDVPRDKRLLQLNTARLHSRSGLGRILDQALQTVQNFYVEDATGNRYSIVGKYAIASVNGREVIEVQYFPEQAGTIGGLGAFTRIKDEHLKGDYQLVLLFLVDPGAEITSFSTGGDATRKDDLSGENLVAPR